jgi:hypothetical protein
MTESKSDENKARRVRGEKQDVTTPDEVPPI